MEPDTPPPFPDNLSEQQMTPPQSSVNMEPWSVALRDYRQQAETIQEKSALGGERSHSESSNSEDKRMLRVGDAEPKSKPWGLGILLLLLAAAVVVTFFGALKRGDLSDFFRNVKLRSTPQVLFLESRQDKTLILETDGERQRVIILSSDRADWRLISQDDFTAANPALSPDGLWVAYLSTRDAPQLVLTPLEQPGQIRYTSADLEDFSARNRLAATTICPWTPIAWAPDSTQLAFFGCADDPPLSQVFVADLLTPTLQLQPNVITDTLTNSSPRQILWNGADLVLVTFPATTPTKVETIVTFPVP